MPGKSVAHADQTSFLVAIIEAKYLGLGISVLSQTVAKLAATVILCGRISQNSGLAERGHCSDVRRDALSAKFNIRPASSAEEEEQIDFPFAI